MKATPRGLRLHVAFFGRRNAGKSSLLNGLVRFRRAIVSPVAGTTTDPVHKAMELQPIGPVLLVDTAGIDDEGSLGAERMAKTRQVLERTDLGIVVAAAGVWGSFEKTLLGDLAARDVPSIVVFNKTDLARPAEDLVTRLRKEGHGVVETVATEDRGFGELRKAIVESVPESFLQAPAILGDLLPPGGLAMLVVPIDKEAPKGRLILPQVQSLRDLLDSDAMAMVVKERELALALRRLKEPPDLVVTDSQAFLKVVADTPPELPLTSFSVLFARFKGDLDSMVQGVLAIDGLRDGDRILVAEACSHHPVTEDIGRVKIPRWLRQYSGARLEIETVQGRDFPEDVSPYALVIHCGGCVWNRRSMLSRIASCQAQGVPITNYGLCIAFSLGILERALSPFPSALALLRESR